MRFDCAQTEIAFLRKRLVQLEERLESELGTRTGLEQKASAPGPGHGRGQGLPRVTLWSGAHCWSWLSSPCSCGGQSFTGLRLRNAAACC